MTTPATNSPTCPRDLLRCAGCGRYSEATPEQRAQADAADAAFDVAQADAAEREVERRRRPC